MIGSPADSSRAADGVAGLLLRLWRHLSRRRRSQFYWILALVLLAALAEVASLGAVLPFLTVIAAPDAAFRQPVIASIARSLGVESSGELVLALTVAFVAAAVVSAAIRLVLLRCSTRYAFATGSEISIDVYRRTLYQPYRVHVARSSSSVISGITQKVGGTMFGVLLPSLTLISSAVTIATILSVLIAIDATVALAAAIGFGAGYGAVTWRARRSLRNNSRLIAREQTQLVKALQEGLGGIRDVLLDGTQPVYCDVYRRADEPLRLAQGANVFIGQSPRYAMEALGMVLIAALAYGLSRQPGGIATALPVLGALALGAQRLLPALQQAYGSWASIVGNQASLRDTINLLDQPIDVDAATLPDALELRHSIHFDDVGFRYADTGPWVLHNVSLVIPRGARVGFVGPTGGGKSTTMDLLMALLTPTEGEIRVDGVPVTGALARAWQRAIAHVPQSIYLADTTIAENIAFGVPAAAIDHERVHAAACRAQIADFIESGPQGYDAIVGERGIRLSGGQRQRIGIARALYKQAKVLVFDEATSALDNVTERTLLDAIAGLDRSLTILIIAHRLTTVRRCDTIVELAEGRVVEQGTYDELLGRSPSFRLMAGAGQAT